MIQVKDLGYFYKEKETIFENLQLEMKKGYVYGLLGKNGAGKTTLLKLLTGIIFPKNGSIHVENEIPMKRRISFLQDMYFIPEEMGVNDYTQSDFEEKYSFFYPKFDHEQFQKLLDEYQIPKNKKLFSISQGERKKYFLSFAFATNCNYLFLDEPTNGLDIPSKSTFRKHITKYINQDRLIVISTHQVRDVSSLIDSIVVLNKGKIDFNHSIEEISKFLTVTIHRDNVVPPESLFHKKSIFGLMSLDKNTSNELCEINVELLFNALMSNAEKVNSLFRKS